MGKMRGRFFNLGFFFFFFSPCFFFFSFFFFFFFFFESSYIFLVQGENIFC